MSQPGYIGSLRVAVREDTPKKSVFFVVGPLRGGGDPWATKKQKTFFLNKTEPHETQEKKKKLLVMFSAGQSRSSKKSSRGRGTLTLVVRPLKKHFFYVCCMWLLLCRTASFKKGISWSIAVQSYYHCIRKFFLVMSCIF